MADILVRCFYVLSFIVMLCSQIHSSGPEVKIQAFKPKGFRASIPVYPDMYIFIFRGDVNRQASGKDNDILKITYWPVKGRWVVEDTELKLKVGDVINYAIRLRLLGALYFGSHTIADLECNMNPTEFWNNCWPTVTRVRGGRACAGQTIFEEDFDSLKEDVWQIEQFIPINHPEFPFVSYQRLFSDPTVSVVNGNLRITPKLQQNQPGFNNESIYSGSLNLFSGCTGSATECSAQAWGASILPPVVSGRVTSKGLAFTYGTVHIRAKLPQGDWLYPEILLESLVKRYGIRNYASGVIRIASARGNKELNFGVTDYGNKVLYGGPIMDSECRQNLIYDKKSSNSRTWGDDFHVYSIIWKPDRITLLVDCEEWARIEPPTGGLQGNFPSNCTKLPREMLSTGTKMAPFDEHFHLTFGLAAGGVTEFRDNLYSRGIPKPWRNQARKATLNFWQAMDSWYPTWTNAELLVDYVKVIAL